MMKTGAHVGSCFELKKGLPQSECYEGVKKESCMRASETKK